MTVPGQHAPSIVSRLARTLTSLIVIAASTAGISTAVAQTVPMRLEIVGPVATGFGPTFIDSRRRVAGVLAGTNVALKRGGTIEDLGPGYVVAMDGHGRLLGSIKNASGVPRAAMWDRKGQPAFLSPDGLTASANGANGRGDIVGDVDFRAKVWMRGGRMTDLGPGTAKDINELGDVVGGSDAFAALWQSGTRTLLSANPSFAYAINDDGRIVGIDYSAPLSARLWYQGQDINLGAAYPLGSLANDINQAGDIVGYVVTPTAARAVVWRAGTDGSYAAIELDTFLRPEAFAAGWRLYGAVGINDRGDMIGYATNQILCGQGVCQPYGFILTDSRLADDYPVPAP